MKKFIWGLDDDLIWHVIAHAHLDYDEVVRLARAVESTFAIEATPSWIMRSDR